MSTALRLRIVPALDGAWRLALDDGGGRPVEAQVPAEAVQALIADVGRLLAPRPGVVVPGRDAARTRAEEDAGRALAHLLRADVGVAGRLAWALGSAQGRGEVPALVVDAVDPVARELPWELLADPADGQPLEPSGRCVIARLVPLATQPPPRGAGPLAPAVWCPTPDDPACGARLAALAPELAPLGPVLALPPEGVARAVPASDVLLHVVCHGERLTDEVRLLLGDADRGAGTAAHALGPLLARCAVVVLDVCDGGHPGVGELDTVAGRFLAGGAAACVAPLRRTSVQAAARFAEGFSAAVGDGASLVAAVAAGRRAVRGLAIALPESRWCNHALWVGHVGALAPVPLVPRAWRPAGWPAPAPPVASLLDRAAALSKALHSGFVGVEHLALAAAEGSGAGFLSGRVRALLARRADAVRGMLATWLPTGLPDEAGGTPRLRAWAASLAPGFDEESLWRVVASDPGCALPDLAGVDRIPGAAGDLDVTLRSVFGGHDDEERPPATRLEVAAGPEDGRGLAPEPGDVLGRATQGGSAPLALYGGTATADRRLSRSHLRWVGPGQVEALRPLRRHRAGRIETFSGGPVGVRAGDLLQLGTPGEGTPWAGTWLRAR